MLQLERIERRVLGERQGVLHAIASLGVDMELPTVQEAWDEFDAALAQPTRRVVIDPEREDLLRALGLRP